MKNLNILFSLILLFAFSLSPILAQEEDIEDQEQENKPTRAHYESAWLIDNQSVVVPKKKTLEFMIQHRFGIMDNGIKDLWGLFAPSNIRLGLSYTLFDDVGFGMLKGPLAVGFGTTKDQRIQDVNLKLGMLQQTRNGKVPVSISYFGNIAMETFNVQEDLPNGNSSDRYSYFHQLIISRKFSSKLSLQLAPSVSHFNVVNPLINNDHVALAAGGRYKITAQSSVIFNADQPITKHEYYNPQPNLSFGIEVATSAHSFQVFVTNYSSLIPQYNNVLNQNDPYGDGWLIGFNINRLWNF